MIVEPLAPGWHYLQGASYAHLIRSITPGGGGSAVCGREGTKISNRGATEMVRCVECDLAQQLI